MASGAEHYRQAETWTANAWKKGGPDGDTLIHTDSQRRDMLKTAHIHATLALAAATARANAANMPALESNQWNQVA
jgi:hypothetical protein